MPRSEKAQADRTQMKTVKLHRNKKKMFKSLPLFENLGLPRFNFDPEHPPTIIVEDILTENDPQVTIVNDVGFMFSRLAILSITCPICGKVVQLDPHWNCFNCNHKNDDGYIYERYRFEILEVKQ